MSSAGENEEFVPWPTKKTGVRVPVSAMIVRTHLANLEPNARRAINVSIFTVAHREIEH